MLSPPMFRTTPLWFSDGLAEIMRKFSVVFSVKMPDNFLLLPSFANPVLEADGIHLTPFSGLEYVLHLFDAANAAIDALRRPVSAATAVLSGSVRVLEDRMMVVEQHQSNTVKRLDYQSAIFSEAADVSENQRHDDHLTLSGLARPPAGLSTLDWQLRAKQDVGGIVKIVLNREAPIQVVHNQTGSRRTTTYLVKMVHVQDAKEIRSKFGSFFAGGKDSRPASLKGISIGNWTTPATKVRIAVLKVLAERCDFCLLFS